MKRVKVKAIALFLTAMMVAMGIQAATYEGEGPNLSGEGSTLRVEERDGRVVLMHYTIFRDNRRVTEEFRPNAQGAWDVIIRAHGKTGSAAAPVTYQFASTDQAAAAKAMAGLGWKNVDWQKEPGRLVKYFLRNKKEFTLVKQ